MHTIFCQIRTVAENMTSYSTPMQTMHLVERETSSRIQTLSLQTHFMRYYQAALSKVIFQRGIDTFDILAIEARN